MKKKGDKNYFRMNQKQKDDYSGEGYVNLGTGDNVYLIDDKGKKIFAIINRTIDNGYMELLCFDDQYEEVYPKIVNSNPDNLQLIFIRHNHEFLQIHASEFYVDLPIISDCFTDDINPFNETREFEILSIEPVFNPYYQSKNN